jgi:hypothetical protein
MQIRSPLDTHLLALYRDESFLGATVAAFLAEGLALGEGAVLLLGLARWQAVRLELELRRVDVAAALDDGRLAVLDAGTVLTRMCAGDGISEARLQQELGPTFERVRSASLSFKVRAFGDLAGHLWRRGDFDGALRLEIAWHELLKTESVTLLCSYEADPLDPSHDAGQLMQLFRTHGRVHACQDGARRRDAVRLAMDEVLGIREVGRLHIVLAAAGLPSGDEGTADLTLLWLRTQVPHLAARVLRLARAWLEQTTPANAIAVNQG